MNGLKDNLTSVEELLETNLHLESIIVSSSKKIFASCTASNSCRDAFSAARGASDSKTKRLFSSASSSFSSPFTDDSWRYCPLILDTMPFSVKE